MHREREMHFIGSPARGGMAMAWRRPGARAQERPAAGRPAVRYRVRTADGEAELGLWQFALHRQVVRAAIPTSLVVGTLLTVINQGNVYLQHRVTAALVLRTLATFAVPYCVATFGALSAARTGVGPASPASASSGPQRASAGAAQGASSPMTVGGVSDGRQPGTRDSHAAETGVRRPVGGGRLAGLLRARTGPAAGGAGGRGQTRRVVPPSTDSQRGRP